MRTNKVLVFSATAFASIWILAIADNTRLNDKHDTGKTYERALPGWRTNTAKRLVELDELEPGGPGKDGIPAIDSPNFVKSGIAAKWLNPAEPVISLVVGKQAKVYPLQILIWHEIVNDQINNIPVVVTFCPLCYSANVFERRVDGNEYTFGVSGMLRHSDMVMYDRQTESFWQQITGEAIVGDTVGSKLKWVPAQIISFEQFRSTYEDGLVLSRNTGFQREYGQNPYVGYDNISQTPFMYHGKYDGRLKPMEKLITVSINDVDKAYPYSITEKHRAINDTLGGIPIAVFHTKGALSALDKKQTALSRQVGSTGVFDRRVEGVILTFSYVNGKINDEQTGSVWSITGKAMEGKLKGKKLQPIAHGDYFSFAWLTFKPGTKIYGHR